MKPTVILFCGQQGAGKTTTAKLLAKELERRGVLLKTLKFAGPLYKAHDAVYKVLAEEYGFEKPSAPDGDLLQLLGKWGREKDPKIWSRLGAYMAMNMLMETPAKVVIFDDCRFPNEIEAIEWIKQEIPDLIIKKIELFAPEDTRRERAEKWRKNTTHDSEISLLGYRGFDASIDTAKNNPESCVQYCLNLLGIV